MISPIGVVVIAVWSISSPTAWCAGWVVDAVLQEAWWLKWLSVGAHAVALWT